MRLDGSVAVASTSAPRGLGRTWGRVARQQHRRLLPREKGEAKPKLTVQLKELPLVRVHLQMPLLNQPQLVRGRA